MKKYFSVRDGGKTVRIIYIIRMLKRSLLALLFAAAFMMGGCTADHNIYYPAKDISKYQDRPVISVILKDGQKIYFNRKYGYSSTGFSGTDTIITITGEDINNKPLTIDLREVATIQFQNDAAKNASTILLITAAIVAIAITIPIIVFSMKLSHTI